jgi:hypothetical protein
MNAKSGNECKSYLPDLNASYEKTCKLAKEYLG